MSEDIQILIVDDSAIVRETLSMIIEAEPGLAVMGKASDPFSAAERIKVQVPDVIVLDIEMPRMDGITFLRRIMAQRPIPVVICSSLIAPGNRALVDALEAGAVDIVTKPNVGTKKFLEESSVQICDKIRAASRAKLGYMGHTAAAPRPVSASSTRKNPDKCDLIAIGASTGGTEALRNLLSMLPPALPPIVVVQHMPEQFTSTFADYLNEKCSAKVVEAGSGMIPLPGHVYLAPGNRHMKLRQRGDDYLIDIYDGPLINRHRPSVDVLFEATAELAGDHAIGVLLTGMGDDGARGLKSMHEAGAFTIGQNQQSCVVYGMSRAAHSMGAVDLEASPTDIASAIKSYLRITPGE